MKMSPQGLAALAQFEGVVTVAYRDSVGVLTIGVGHTAAAGPPIPKAGMTITRQEAMDILARDLPQYEAAVLKRMPQVPQWVFDGAVSFCFNLGAGNFAKASWVAKYAEGHMAEAEASLKTWNKAGGRVLQGLSTRRKMEADMIFRNRYPDGRSFQFDNGALPADTRKPGLVVGDSIAVGTGAELGGFETNAKVGIPSSDVIMRVVPGYRYYVISAGSNDWNNPLLVDNIGAMRQRADGTVIWIVPRNATAADAVRKVASRNGDSMVTFVPGADGVHPKSYQALARDVMAVIHTIEAQPQVSDQPVIPDGPPPVMPRPPDDPGPTPPEPTEEPQSNADFYIGAGIMGALFLAAAAKMLGAF